MQFLGWLWQEPSNACSEPSCLLPSGSCNLQLCQQLPELYSKCQHPLWSPGGGQWLQRRPGGESLPSANQLCIQNISGSISAL